MRITSILLLASLLAGCHDKPSLSTKSGGYAGDWVSTTSSHKTLSIEAEGAAFVVQDQTRKKYAGTISDGVLKVPGLQGGMDILRVESTDHLIAGGEEYRRMDAAEAAVVASEVDALGNGRESMKRMRNIAVAWEARATDINSYTVENVAYGNVSTDSLAGSLHPTYIRDMPRTDGWGHPFVFTVSENGNVYSIRSFGANGRRDATPPGAHDSPGADIVFSNGSFESYPSSIQMQ